MLQSPYPFAIFDSYFIQITRDVGGLREHMVDYFFHTPFIFSHRVIFHLKREHKDSYHCFVIGDTHQFCISLFTYYTYFTCGFFSILDKFSLDAFESQNFYVWNKFRGSTIFRYPHHNCTESASLQQM